MLIGLAALLACEGIFQYLLGANDIDRRIRGPFSHYMTFSGFLLISDLLLLAAMVYAGRWRSPWRWAALAVINAALLGTYTRNAWVALALSLTVLILIRRPRLLLAYLPAAALFVVLAPVPVLHRVASIADLRDASNYDRLCMLKAGLTMVRERPLFGIGPDLVKRRYAIYRPLSAPRLEVPHLHNSWLQIAAEQGLPSLAAYLALTLSSATLAWRRFVREGGRLGPGRTSTSASWSPCSPSTWPACSRTTGETPKCSSRSCSCWPSPSAFRWPSAPGARTSGRNSRRVSDI